MAWTWRKLLDGTSLDDLRQRLNTSLLQLTHEITPRVVTMLDGDATPSVKDVDVLVTAGTTAITGFDDGYPGQLLLVLSASNITFDTTSSGLTGSSVDLATVSPDTTAWFTADGLTWRLMGFVDASVDNSGGA